GGDEGHEVVAVGRAEHDLGRAADAEPGDAGQRRILGQPAAHRWQSVDETLGSEGGHHWIVLAGSFASSSGSACAQLVMLPAPRRPSGSPGPASWANMPASAAGRGSASTWRGPWLRRPSAKASRLMPSIGGSPAGETAAADTVAAEVGEGEDPFEKVRERVVGGGRRNGGDLA